jgi:thiamine kinase-like enzyme
VGLEDKIAKARTHVDRKKALADGSGVEGAFWIDRARTAVSFFPFDAEIPALGRLASADASAKLLARIFRDAPVPPRGDVVALAYKPGRRFVGRIELADGRGAVVRLYASASRARSWRLPPRLVDGRSLRLAARIGGSKRHQAIAFDWFEGTSLRDRIRADPAAPQTDLPRVAQAIAELHGTSLDGAERLVPRLPADGLREIERELAWLRPDLTRLLEKLRSRLESRLSEIVLANRLVHGDLYDKQIIVRQDGIGLIDLDEIGVGDPRQDLGLLVAHWERDRLVGDLGDAHGSIVTDLVEAYARASATSSSTSAIPVFAAAALFRLAQHPFRVRMPDWACRIEALVDRVDELISS